MEPAGGSVLRQRSFCPYVEVDFTRVAGVCVAGDGEAGGGRVRSRLLVVQDSGQQGWPSLLLPLLSVLLFISTSCILRWWSAADVVSVRKRRTTRVWEGECVGWSGPALLLSIFTLPLLQTAEAGLLLLQILKVIGRLSSEDLQVPVLIQQRGGADEDEQTHSHDHGPGQFHPLNVGAASAAHGLRCCGHVARNRNGHPHQHHHHTQHQPHAWGRAQVQLGLEGFAFPQVSAACWEAGRRRLGGAGGGGAADRTGCCHPLASGWTGRRKRGQRAEKTQELIKKVLRAAPEGRAQGVLERR